MNEHDEPAARGAQPLTPGAKRVGPGEHVFHLGTVNEVMAAPDYSPVHGGVVEGERMIVARMTAPAGGIGEPHFHPNEQWIYVLEGAMEMTIDGTSISAGVGDVVYIPANALHSSTFHGDQKTVFFTVKDASHGLSGIKADPAPKGG